LIIKLSNKAENGLNTLEGQPFDELMCIWDKAKELVG
jgi:hypothetical protein